MYQRSGSSDPHVRAKPFMASTGKPTPAKPKAGEQTTPVSVRPVARFSTSSWNSAPSER